MKQEFDLFGNEIIHNPLLRDKFIEPPFSILDTKTGTWQNRKRIWKNIGLKSEIGRDEEMTFKGAAKSFDYYRVKEGKKQISSEQGTSIFDPALCEVLYHWFCEEGGRILDPFAGGSVRGIVANYLGYKYTGIDIRQEQIDSNREQALDILDVNNQPQWYVGDSNVVLNDYDNEHPFFNCENMFDFIFSCPPYADLEVYSDLEGDISNKPYNEFLELYESIIEKSCKLLKVDAYACFVVGEVRDKKGNYIGFVPDTIRAFQKCGMKFYNEAILLNPVASASMRADKQFTAGQKLVKIHQNVLIFKKC
jgi:DNA modification methylase